MSAFGKALIDFFGGGKKSSYTAKGWHAQLRTLTSSPKGYAALEDAGLSITPKTLIKWLSDPEYPVRSSNVRQIQAAYDIRRGTWNPANETHQYEISGTVKIGNDIRDRGNGMAPLRIDGDNGEWSRIRDAYENGTLTAAQAEDFFVEDVIEEDIGETTEPFEFPGSSYTIV